MCNSSAVPQINSLSDTGEALPFNGWDYKYKSLKVPGFYLGTTDPSFQESFLSWGSRERARGSRSGEKELQQRSEENSCSSSSEGLRGAPRTHGEGLHRLSRCWDAKSGSQWTASAQGWWSGKTGQATPGQARPRGMTTVKLRIYCTQVSALLFNTST